MDTAVNRPTVYCLAGFQNPATTESAIHANPRRTPALQGCEDWRRLPVLQVFTFLIDRSSIIIESIRSIGISVLFVLSGITTSLIRTIISSRVSSIFVIAGHGIILFDCLFMMVLIILEIRITIATTMAIVTTITVLI